MSESTVKSLQGLNALVEAVDLPMDFAAALMTGRPELIRRPQGLTGVETTQVVNALGVLIRTNQALRDHVGSLNEQVTQLRGQVKGIMTRVDQIDDTVNFRDPLDTIDMY